MKCSQIKCIVNRLVGHREVRLGRVFLKRPDGVVCEQLGPCTRLWVPDGFLNS